MMFAGIYTHPGRAAVSRAINAAAKITVLKRVAGKNLVGVARVNQDAREISERKNSAAPRPMLAAIVRQVKGLFCSYINERRALGVLDNYVDSSVGRHATYLLPVFSSIAGNQDAGSR